MALKKGVELSRTFHGDGFGRALLIEEVGGGAPGFLFEG